MEENKIQDESAFLSSLFDLLYPICRSIMGDGYRESLEILAQHVPFNSLNIPSKTKVFDWEVPLEWRIRGGYLKDPNGNTIADFNQSNLSVVNYSYPVKAKMSLEELRPHLFSVPNLPEAIPYVTSYYKRNWGFCLPHNVISTLQDGTYTAVIDSEFVDGNLTLGHAVLPGKSKKVILLSSYLCHPSMANNELSGPLVLTLLYQRLKQKKNLHYTYEFLINPETIGSLAFLHLHGERLRNELHAGLVLTCLGGPATSLTYKKSREGNRFVDQAAEYFARQTGMDIRPFKASSGSDERQYCSPGFNFPVGQMARTIYADFPQYHTSLDNKEFMGISPLIDAADQIEKFIELLEYGRSWTNLSPYGEPQLGKRGLYPTMNNHADPAVKDRAAYMDRMMTILNSSDGKTPLIGVADQLDSTVEELIPIVDKLQNAGLLE